MGGASGKGQQPYLVLPGAHEILTQICSKPSQLGLGAVYKLTENFSQETELGAPPSVEDTSPPEPPRGHPFSSQGIPTIPLPGLCTDLTRLVS